MIRFRHFRNSPSEGCSAYPCFIDAQSGERWNQQQDRSRVGYSRVWTLANSIPGALFGDDANDDGIPNGMLWALGLDTSDNPIPPGTTGTVTITLPSGDSVRGACG
jgi:hypothetical protein